VTSADPIPVRTLLGAKGFETSCLCLRSLVEYSADPVRLVIHEDGTLTDKHRDQLRQISPGTEFVGRAAADEAVEGLLARYPRCLEFRRTEVLALKLFDIVLLAPGRLAYCDSDVLFLRRYAGLFTAPVVPGRPVFMTDVGHAYSVRPWKLWPFGPVRLVGRLNTGITLTPPAYLDLSFLEWLLGVLSTDPVFVRRRYWTEQTCWAALAARTGADLLDPRRVVLATRTMDGYSADAVAIHFVTTFRNQLPAFEARQRPAGEAAVTVGVRPSRRIGPARMLWTDLRRRLSPIG
jgi:hypothetical protein